MATSWDRIEPHTRLENIEEGLQARIADPLWMLARQWQMGEFRGEDAASPIHAHLEVSEVRLDTFRNEAGDGRVIERRNQVPLEARVEAEMVTDGPAAVRLAAEAGLQFLRRLEAKGLGDARPDFRRVFPLKIDPAVLDGLPDRHALRLKLLARRAIDGHALARARKRGLARLKLSDRQMKTLRPLWQRWREEVKERFVEPDESGDAWANERLEYSFSIAAHPAENDEVQLSAVEYPGGHLDWYSFDVADDESAPHGTAAGKSRDYSLDVLPVPLAYSGMPASRWWEFEEGSVYFGGIEAGPSDIGRLAVAEYATIYSDDWFLVPTRAEVGTLVRIKWIDVIDTFGETHRAESTAVLDRNQAGADDQRAWRFYELAGDRSAESGETPWLALLPTLVASIGSDPVEQVGFVRDEGANLVWGVEAKIEAPTGRALRRRLLWGLAQGESAAAEAAEGQAEVLEADDGQAVDGPEPESAPESADEESDAWLYRLQMRVPPWWIPFVAERVEEGSAEIRLRRARMLAWEELETRFVGAHGKILAPWRALRLFEEEVPGGGIEVTRAWQLARGRGGGVHLWMARHKRPGRGERGSGLKFDVMKR